ncbi:MAG TPA: helix-turn-helix transcriptional regulator [Pseudonocardia sp.]|nr:helix-turn-helix transcriptional regulator [Pseudonocardia sp.]
MTKDSGSGLGTRPAGESLGERIAHLRLRTGMTQTGLASRAGVSVDVIRKLEQGQRHTVSIPNLHKLARALDVDAGTLLSKPHQLPVDDDMSGAVIIRRTLTSIDDLIDDDPGIEPITIDEVKRTVTYGWGSYWAGRFDQLGQLLPTAIGQARATLRAARADDRADASDLTARVLQLAACTLVQLGYTDIAHLALREALGHAASGSDPLRVQALRGSLAWVLLVEGRFFESGRVAASSAAAITPDNSSPMVAWSLYGSLLLSSATAAGRAGDRAGALALVDEAEVVAGRTGNRNDYETAFGPHQVGMQRVDVETVTEHFTAALTAGRAVPRDSSLPLAARARHLSDIALAHTRLGHDGDAVEVLDAMVTMAPAWTRYQEQPKMIYRELRERVSHPPRLARVGRKLGVTSV